MKPLVFCCGRLGCGKADDGGNSGGKNAERGTATLSDVEKGQFLHDEYPVIRADERWLILAPKIADLSF